MSSDLERLIDRPWVAVDLEMTGLDPEVDRVCEVGLSWRDGATVEGWSALVKPGVPMHPVAAEVHGIDTASLADAPGFEAVADVVRRRLEGAVVFAHGARLDRRFLTDAFERMGQTMPEALWVDTLLLARRALALQRHRLSDVAASLGVPDEADHRALGDARTTLGIGHRLLELVDPQRAWAVADLVDRMSALDRRSPERKAQKDVLRGALKARRRVRMAYLSKASDGGFRRQEREVDLHRIRFPRVQGFCHLRGAERVFRLERMCDVAVLDATYEIGEFTPRI